MYVLSDISNNKVASFRSADRSIGSVGYAAEAVTVDANHIFVNASADAVCSTHGFLSALCVRVVSSGAARPMSAH